MDKRGDRCRLAFFRSRPLAGVTLRVRPGRPGRPASHRARAGRTGRGGAKERLDGGMNGSSRAAPDPARPTKGPGSIPSWRGGLPPAATPVMRARRLRTGRDPRRRRGHRLNDAEGGAGVRGCYLFLDGGGGAGPARAAPARRPPSLRSTPLTARPAAGRDPTDLTHPTAGSQADGPEEPGVERSPRGRRGLTFSGPLCGPHLDSAHSSTVEFFGSKVIFCILSDTMPYPDIRAQDVADYFLGTLDEESGDNITQLKLQKLLVLRTGAPCRHA